MTSRSILYAVAFCIGGLLLALVAEGLVLAVLNAGSYRVTPRGLGWIVIPVLAAIAGFKIGREFEPTGILSKLNGLSRESRLIIVSGVIWISLCVSVFALFDPFDTYYWRSAEWFKFLFILFGPIALALISKRLFGWALKETETK